MFFFRYTIFFQTLTIEFVLRCCPVIISKWWRKRRQRMAFNELAKKQQSRLIDHLNRSDLLAV